MTTSRRGMFGWLAAGVAGAAVVVKARPVLATVEERPFLGQIRAVHSHFETRPYTPPGLPHSGVSYTTSVAVCRYEQWNGKEWADVGGAPLMAPQAPTHTHTTSVDGSHSHSFRLAP